jgi:hypothetical protein
LLTANIEQIASFVAIQFIFRINPAKSIKKIVEKYRGPSLMNLFLKNEMPSIFVLRFLVIKYPESTKNKSTPKYPLPKVSGHTWNNTTPIIAIALRKSNVLLCIF